MGKTLAGSAANTAAGTTILLTAASETSTASSSSTSSSSAPPISFVFSSVPAATITPAPSTNGSDGDLTPAEFSSELTASVTYRR